VVQIINGYEIVTENLEEKRPLAKPMHRWKYINPLKLNREKRK
jgi:hypothetical protein